MCQLQGKIKASILDIETYKKQSMKMSSPNKIYLLLLLGFITIMGIAGREDYNQAVIESIPVEAYHAIREKLGPECSNRDIVKEYELNREEYDSLYAVWK